MSSEKSLTPQIRFKGFTEAWEQRKLGELYTPASEKNDGSIGRDRIISVANMYFNPIVYVTDDEYLKTYNVMRLGDIAFEGNRSKRYAHGRFVENFIGDGIISHVFKVFRPRLPFDLLYWKYAINNELVMRDVLTKSTKASTMMHELVSQDFLKEGIAVPSCLDEERQIGALFAKFDNLIALHQRKLDALKKIKSALLEKMFPKDGSDIPEIRFTGFTEAWEQRKLGDIAAFSKGQGFSKSNLTDSGSPVILYGRLYTNYETQICKVDTFVKSSSCGVLSKGGEVIVPASGETAEDIAVASHVSLPGILLGGDLNVVTPKDNLDSNFLALFITFGNAHVELSKRAQGKSVVHVRNGDLSQLNIKYPTQSEQILISNLFIKNDSLITLHQRKLDALKKIKSALLEKMFV